MVQDIRSPLSSNEQLIESRTGLVRIQLGADTALFGGWGVRI